MKAPSSPEKYLTAYQRIAGRDTLAHFHVAPLQKLYGDLVTSQSRELLKQREKLKQVFEVAAAHKPELFNRYVLPCGCMVDTMRKDGLIKASCSHGSAEVEECNIVSSALDTLAEIERLFFDPAGVAARGGVLYSFAFAQACYYLATIWKFGEKTIYELSGNAMIRYMVRPDFVCEVEKILLLLKQHLPDLVPDHIESRIVPALAWRFGYPLGDAGAATVMHAHDQIIAVQNLKRQYLRVERGALPEEEGHSGLQDRVQKKEEDFVRSCNRIISPLVGMVRKHAAQWELFSGGSDGTFFSQHDLIRNGGKMQLLEAYLDISFGELLRILDVHKQRMNTFTKRFCEASDKVG